jgi:uncharacterized protein (TIGR03085 family)
MTTYAGAERQSLVAALTEAGPDAATLCEGWRTRHLAAHVVIREARPDTGLGLVVPAFSGWTNRVLEQYADRDYAGLLAEFAAGPPRFSLFAIPGADELLNLAEYYVHTEDVLRAAPGWTARALGEGLTEEFWLLLTQRAGLLLRNSPVPLLLSRPSGEVVKVAQKKAGALVTLSGEPGELVLFAFGRTSVAQVEVDGSPEALRLFSGFKPGL